jgi:hypothetical protein
MTYFQTIKYTIIVSVFFFGTSLWAKTSCEKGTEIMMAMTIANAPVEVLDYAFNKHIAEGTPSDKAKDVYLETMYNVYLSLAAAKNNKGDTEYAKAIENAVILNCNPLKFDYWPEK